MFNLTEALGPNKSGERGSTGCNNAQVAPPMMQQAPRPSCVPNCHPWQPCTGQLLNSFYLHLKPTAEDLLLPPFHLQVFKLLPSPLDLLPLRIGLRSKWTVRAWSRGGKSHQAPQRPSGQPRAVAPVYQAGSLFKRLGGKHLRVQYSVGKRVQTCRGKMEPILAILPK